MGSARCPSLMDDLYPQAAESTHEAVFHRWQTSTCRRTPVAGIGIDSPMIVSPL